MARVEAKLDTFKDTLVANNQTLVDQIKALFTQQPQPSIAAPLPHPAQAQLSQHIAEVHGGK